MFNIYALFLTRDDKKNTYQKLISKACKLNFTVQHLCMRTALSNFTVQHSMHENGIIKLGVLLLA